MKYRVVNSYRSHIEVEIEANSFEEAVVLGRLLLDDLDDAEVARKLVANASYRGYLVKISQDEKPEIKEIM